MKDQSLRKLQQEMDSLTFRNLQLAKRVELLQDELALSEPRGKKNKVGQVKTRQGDLAIRCRHLQATLVLAEDLASKYSKGLFITPGYWVQKANIYY